MYVCVACDKVDRNREEKLWLRAKNWARAIGVVTEVYRFAIDFHWHLLFFREFIRVLRLFTNLRHVRLTFSLSLSFFLYSYLFPALDLAPPLFFSFFLSLLSFYSWVGLPASAALLSPQQVLMRHDYANFLPILLFAAGWSSAIGHDKWTCQKPENGSRVLEEV